MTIDSPAENSLEIDSEIDSGATPLKFPFNLPPAKQYLVDVESMFNQFADWFEIKTNPLPYPAQAKGFCVQHFRAGPVDLRIHQGGGRHPFTFYLDLARLGPCGPPKCSVRFGGGPVDRRCPADKKARARTRGVARPRRAEQPKRLNARWPTIS